MPTRKCYIRKLKDAFLSLKINKSPGYDDISFKVVKECFGVLYKPLQHILTFLFKPGFFQMNLKLQALLLYLKEVKTGT